MKLSESPSMDHIDRQLWTLTADNKPGKPADRVDAHAHMLRVKNLDRYGDWNVHDVSKGSCCRGTVVATLSGKQGRAEMWNNGECYFVPKGGEPVQAPDVASACALAGIAERLPLTC